MEKKYQDYIENKLDHLIKPMIRETLKTRPEDVASFMLDWIKANQKVKAATKDDSEFEESEDVFYQVIIGRRRGNRRFARGNSYQKN